MCVCMCVFHWNIWGDQLHFILLLYINFFNKPITQIGNIKKSWCFCVDLLWVTHSSVLAWRIPGTEVPSRLPSMGSQSRTWLKWLSSSSSSKKQTNKQTKTLIFAFKNFTEKKWPRVESQDLHCITRTNGAHFFPTVFSDITLVAGNCPCWEYLHHRTGKHYRLVVWRAGC